MTKEQAKDMKKLMEIDFVIHETVLYLDGHPENKKALDFYNKVNNERKKAYDMYVSRYGPLNAYDVRQNSWTWIDTPWPWQREN